MTRLLEKSLRGEEGGTGSKAPPLWGLERCRSGAVARGGEAS